MSSDDELRAVSERAQPPLVVAFSDSGYLPLLKLWVERLGALGVARLRVYCLDAQTFDWCQSRSVPAAALPWSGNLRELWVQRILVFKALLDAGEEIVHSDIDAIWIRDPLRSESVCSREEDLVFSQGTVWPIDVHQRWGFVLCCGWFRARPAPAARAFFEALASDVQSTGDDQISVNRLLAGYGAEWDAGAASAYRLPFRDRWVRCWSGTIRAKLATNSLSVALLPHREFQRLPEPFEGAVVKHYLTPKNCDQKLAVLRQLGVIGLAS